jgi:hypothetical protein
LRRFPSDVVGVYHCLKTVMVVMAALPIAVLTIG